MCHRGAWKQIRPFQVPKPVTPRQVTQQNLLISKLLNGTQQDLCLSKAENAVILDGEDTTVTFLHRALNHEPLLKVQECAERYILYIETWSPNGVDVFIKPPFPMKMPGFTIQNDAQNPSNYPNCSPGWWYIATPLKNVSWDDDIPNILW